MRTAHLVPTAAIAAAMVAATVGCAANTDAHPEVAQPSVSISPTANPAASPAGAVGEPSPTAGGRTPTMTPSPRVNVRRVTPGPIDGDRRGDLVRGARTLTGTVHRDGDWVLLDVAGKRWALLGGATRSLKAGQTATTIGTLTQPPAGCPVDMALTVTRVS
jgi:hypothetical protein